MEFLEDSGGGGSWKNPFHGGGIYIFWNYTLHYFVFQVDGPYAAVKFPPKDSALQASAAALSNDEAGGSLLQDVRLLRKDELQVTATV